MTKRFPGANSRKRLIFDSPLPLADILNVSKQQLPSLSCAKQFVSSSECRSRAKMYDYFLDAISIDPPGDTFQTELIR